MPSESFRPEFHQIDEFNFDSAFVNSDNRDLLQKIFWPHFIVVTNRQAPQHRVWSVNFCNRSEFLGESFSNP